MNHNIASSQVFFTIVIPTRDRSDTLIHAISSALAQEYGSFQVLISDNASLDDTREKVMAMKDPRLKYVNTGKRVSMSENWEFALNHVKHGWVTILGDDDAILPGSLSRVNQIISETGTDAIRANGCSFAWPGVHSKDYGRLRLSLRKGYEIRNSSKALRDVLMGRLNYNELPVLYNGGFISVRLVENAKRQSESFFHSVTPDVYSGVVFSLLTKNYIYSHEPLAINGASLHSGGTAAFETSKRMREYDPAEKFLQENNLPFHNDLPLLPDGRPVKSIIVLVYECFLQAIRFFASNQTVVCHRRLMLLALSMSGTRRPEVEEWTVLYSKLHNVAQPGTLILTFYSFLFALSTFTRRANSAFEFFSLQGGQMIPLKNVFEASVAAGLIKDLRPSPIFSATRRLLK